MSFSKKALIASLILFLTSSAQMCQGLEDVQVDVREICKTFESVYIPGIPAGSTQIAEGEFNFDFSKKDIPTLNDTDYKTRVTVSKIIFTPRWNIENFDFLESLVLEAQSSIPEEPLTPVTIAEGPIEKSMDPNGVLTIKGIDDADVVHFVQQGVLLIHFFAFASAFPTHAWEMDVKLCFKAHVDYASP